MNEELKIKVQAFLDGELPEAEAREISSLIAGDADVAALHQELKHTRAALAGFEKRIVLPETREFYWSKLQREIDRAAAVQARSASPPPPLFTWLRRVLVPVASVAVLAVVLFVTLRLGHPTAPDGMEATSMDSSAMTYRNYESGTTLVWLSFPAENGLSGGGGVDRIN